MPPERLHSSLGLNLSDVFLIRM